MSDSSMGPVHEHKPSAGMSLFAGGAHFTPLFMGFDYSQGPASARGHKESPFAASVGGASDVDDVGTDDAEDALVITDCNINSVLENPRVCACAFGHSVALRAVGLPRLPHPLECRR
jgi:hypothetical protein